MKYSHRPHLRRWMTRKPAEYMGTILSGIILLWIVNAVPDWNLSFITHGYMAVMWVLNLALGVQVLGGVLAMLLPLLWFRALVEFVTQLFSFAGSMAMLVIFPFNFTTLAGNWLNTLVWIFLLIGLVVTFFSVIVHLVRLITVLEGSFYRPE